MSNTHPMPKIEAFQVGLKYFQQTEQRIERWHVTLSILVT